MSFHDSELSKFGTKINLYL